MRLMVKPWEPGAAITSLMWVLHTDWPLMTVVAGFGTKPLTMHMAQFI